MYKYNSANGWSDQLTEYNNQQVTYDEIGNIITIGSNTFTWANGRELTSYFNDTINVSYKYNINGIRTSKIVNGIEHKYYVEGNKIIFEDINGTILYYLYNGNDVIGFKYNENMYYYIKNIFGDIISIIDSNHQTIVTYQYDSFGKITSIIDNSNNQIGNINPFRYRSYYYDEETELYYLNKRYYNPTFGRFINIDKYISTGTSIIGNNMYTYCNNNFINMKDENGDFPWIAAVVLVGASLLLSGCTTKNNKSGKPDKDIAKLPDLDRNKAKKEEYNCYGNAIGKKAAIDPTGYKQGESTRTTFNRVKKDVGEKNIRELSSVNDPIAKDENLVALKNGEYDYHFIVKIDGIWYNKPGPSELIVNEHQLNVIAKKWYGRYKNSKGNIQTNKALVYDDETIYFAIKKEWDE